MRRSVVTSILATLAITVAAQHETYTVIALPPIKQISPISPLPPTSTPSSTIISIATITTAPTPYYLITDGNITLPDNTTSCGETLCVDYINTCGIMYGGCFPHCSGDTTPSFSNPGCPSNSHYPGKTPDASMTTATCGYKCDDFVDECGQTYGPGCYTSCEGMPTPGWTKPSCGVSVMETGSGEAVVTEVELSESGTVPSATATGAVSSSIL